MDDDAVRGAVIEKAVRVEPAGVRPYTRFSVRVERRDSGSEELHRRYGCGFPGV